MGASSAFPRGRFPHSDWSMNAPTVGLEPLIRVRTWGVGCNFWILMQKRPNRHPGVCWPSLGDRLYMFLRSNSDKRAAMKFRPTYPHRGRREEGVYFMGLLLALSAIVSISVVVASSKPSQDGAN